MAGEGVDCFDRQGGVVQDGAGHALRDVLGEVAGCGDCVCHFADVDDVRVSGYRKPARGEGALLYEASLGEYVQVGVPLLAVFGVRELEDGEASRDVGLPELTLSEASEACKQAFDLGREWFVAASQGECHEPEAFLCQEWHEYAGQALGSGGRTGAAESVAAVVGEQLQSGRVVFSMAYPGSGSAVGEPA